MFDADEEFFDELYRLWSKTTQAEGSYWMPEEFEDRSGRFKIYAVPDEEGGQRKLVATGVSDNDAEFITGIHGALPELIRVLYAALDEADRADYDKDSRECRIAELEMELIDMKQIIANLSTDPPWHQRG